MLRTVRILVAALWIGLLPPTRAQAVAPEKEPETVQDIVKAVELTYQQIESIQADFVQVTRSATLGDEHRQRGRLTVKRPRKMRWEFSSPSPKLFLTDGTTIWIWSPSENQVIVYRDFSDTGSGVASLLTDLHKLDEHFLVKMVDDPQDTQKRTYTMELVPRDPAGFKALKLSLSRKKFLVERVVITDQFDNVTDLTFSQVRLNGRIPDGDFSFKIPAGAEVITPEGP